MKESVNKQRETTTTEYCGTKWTERSAKLHCCDSCLSNNI